MKILLIEDNKEITDFLKMGLRSENFAVDVASDGEKGLLCALTNDYDVAVIDKNLPKKDGFEVCKGIRGANKTFPIIMLSVESNPEIKAQLLNAGADDYVSKPFSFEELVARIRAVTRRPKQTNLKHILTANDLILDTKTYSVSRGGKEVRLTRKEFMLLEYLMKNKGAVLSRAMIMERVWDENTDPFSNTFEVHILNLRKKVDGGKNKKKLIITVPGRGYKISE